MSQRVEFWSSGACPLFELERQVTDAEAAGWDGVTFGDSQNIGGDCYAASAITARATSKLKIGVSVTNPFTRHPATTASAAASIQSVSDGRFVLSIGRGDSALAYVGFGPSSVGALERYVSVMRRYLHRQYVPFEELEEYGRGANLPPAEDLHLSNNVGASRLEWWHSDTQAPPPIDVAGAGPRVLAVGAREADGVCLAVGADVDRIRWGAKIARDARADTHRNEELSIGAYITVACHPDESVAFDLVRGTLAVFARFSIMHGKPVGPLSHAQETTLTRLAGRYDMAEHSKGASTPAGTIDLDFARQYAVIGPPQTCISRLRELIDAGVTRLVLVRPEPTVPSHLASPEAQRAHSLLAHEVLPALRDL